MSPLVLCCRILRAAASGETIPERAVDSGPQTAGADSSRFVLSYSAPLCFAYGRYGKWEICFACSNNFEMFATE